MKDHFYGLNQEQKLKAELSFKKALIWANCLEQMLDQNEITQIQISESYHKGGSEGLIDNQKVSLDEYVERCYLLLRLWIKLTRAMILNQDEILEKNGGYLNCADVSSNIVDIYYHLIHSLRKETSDVEENTASNVTHILSAKK